MLAREGADALGMVFYPPSPRHLADLALAADICQAAGPFVTSVALFVNPSVEQVMSVLERVPVQLLQFHGDETNDFCRQFARPFIKALRMSDDADPAAAVLRFPSAQGLLLDAYKPGVPGGTGEAFNWSRAPRALSKPWILAGGLTSDNVQAAVAATAPYAVDVSGGVEAAPGIKCHKKVALFLQRLRDTAACSTTPI